MLYTFQLSETALDRIEGYLIDHYSVDNHEYVLAVQHHLTDSLITVVIDCSPETATFLHLLA